MQLAGRAQPAGGDERVDGADHQVDHIDVVGRRVDQRQGAPVVAGRLVVAADANGVVAGADARGERGGEVAGGLGVQRHLAGRAGRAGPGERGEEGGVEAPTLARQEIVVDRLGEQGVPEDVGVAVRDQHLVVDGLAQGVVESRAVEPGDLGEQGVGGRSARAGDGTDDHAGVVVEPVETHEHEVGEALGQRTVGQTGVEELFGVEGVSGGAPDDGLRTLGGEAGGFTGTQDRARRRRRRAVRARAGARRGTGTTRPPRHGAGGGGGGRRFGS